MVIDPCCHLLCNAAGTATYVGATCNLTRRLRQHNGLIFGHGVLISLSLISIKWYRVTFRRCEIHHTGRPWSVVRGVHGGGI